MGGGGLWHFKHSLKIMSETGKNVDVRTTNLTSGLMTNKWDKPILRKKQKNGK